METQFKDILNDFLIENELSQTEFAKRINVKQSQVSEWLKAKCKPGYDVLKAIATTFNVSADYLLGITEERN
jgi:transcriptional regulator with XRE-family HTH domain